MPTLLSGEEGKTTTKRISELVGWLFAVVDLVHVRMSFVRNSGKIIVVKKLANKVTINHVVSNTTESVERSVLTESKPSYPNVILTQSITSASTGLAWLHAAAKRDSQLRVNNLMHLIRMMKAGKATG